MVFTCLKPTGHVVPLCAKICLGSCLKPLKTEMVLLSCIYTRTTPLEIFLTINGNSLVQGMMKLTILLFTIGATFGWKETRSPCRKRSLKKLCLPKGKQNLLVLNLFQKGWTWKLWGIRGQHPKKNHLLRPNLLDTDAVQVVPFMFFFDVVFFPGTCLYSPRSPTSGCCHFCMFACKAHTVDLHMKELLHVNSKITQFSEKLGASAVAGAQASETLWLDFERFNENA